MKSDSRGYSFSLVRTVQAADPNLIGVQLGLFCIENDIPVARVAKDLNCSRHTVYWWFRGRFKPRPEMESRMRDALAKYREEKVV